MFAPWASRAPSPRSPASTNASTTSPVRSVGESGWQDRAARCPGNCARTIPCSRDSAASMRPSEERTGASRPPRERSSPRSGHRSARGSPPRRVAGDAPVVRSQRSRGAAGRCHAAIHARRRSVRPLGAVETDVIGTGACAQFDDHDEILCRLEHRQCERMRVTRSTRARFCIGPGNPATDRPTTEAALDRLITPARRHCGGEVLASWILDWLRTLRTARPRCIPLFARRLPV